MTFPSVEHAFQAAKSLDREVRRRILRQSTPGKAKRAGRLVELRPDWEQVKLRIMKELLLDKFSLENIPLLNELLRTGDRELQEGNWWGDRYWGMVDGWGENHLGKLLMEVRSARRAELAKS